MRLSSISVAVLAAAIVLAPSCSDSDSFKLGPEAKLAFSPTTVEFADVARGKSASRVVTITHVGSAGTISLSPIRLESGSPDLSLGEITRTSLAPGEQSQVQIVYASNDDEPDTGELVIGHNLVNNPETRIPVGTPGQRGELLAQPTSVDFGIVQAGAPAVVPVRVVNVGTAAAQLVGWHAKDDPKGEFGVDLGAYTTVAAGESVTIQLTYLATGRDADRTDIVIQTDRDDVSLTIPVRGEELTPAIITEPGTVQFGWVAPGGTGTLVEIAIKSDGNAPLTVESIELVDNHPAIFIAASSENADLFEELPVTLKPGEIVKVSAYFQPIEELPMSPDPIGKLRVVSNDAVNAPLEVSMFGAAGEPSIIFVPASVVDFGFVAEGFDSRREVTALNIGSKAIDITDAYLTGSTSDEFALTPSDLPITLNPGDTATFEATFVNRKGDSGSEFSTMLVATTDPLVPQYPLDVVARRSDRPECDPGFVPELLSLPAVREGDVVEGIIKIVNFGSGNCEYRESDVDSCLTIRKNNGVRTIFDCDVAGLASLFEVTGEPTYGQVLGPGDALEFEVAYTGRPVQNTALGRDIDHGRLVITMKDPQTQRLVFVAPAGGWMQGVNLRGTSAIPLLRVEPEELDFSFVRTSCESFPQLVRVSNVGPVAAAIDSVQMIGCGQDIFLRPTPGTPVTVPAWSKYFMEAFFSPQMGGVQSCRMRVLTDGFVQNNDNLPYADVDMGGYAIETEHQVDTFTQIPPAKVDVVFVVDDSGSMADEQSLLRTELPKLVQLATEWGQDYRLAVTTTDTKGVAGQFKGPPQYTVPGMSTQTFADLLVVGTTGYWEEMGLEGAWMALNGVNTSDTSYECVNAPGQCPETSPGKTLWCIDGYCRGPNYGFLRDDAELVMVIVSDEEDSSPQSVNWYVSNFAALKKQGSGVGVKIHTIVTPEDGCQGGLFGSVGLRYIQATRAFGGVSADICATDFSAEFAEISAQTFGLKDRFYPTLPPDPATIEVRVNGMVCESGWHWNDAVQAVVFEENGGCMPDYGEDVDIEYDVICYGTSQ